MERQALILIKNEPAVYTQPVFVHMRGGLPLCVVFLVTMFSLFVYVWVKCYIIRLERHDFNFTFSAFTRGWSNRFETWSARQIQNLEAVSRAIHVITVLVILIVQWLKIMNFNLKICFIVFCYVEKRENPIHEYR